MPQGCVWNLDNWAEFTFLRPVPTPCDAPLRTAGFQDGVLKVTDLASVVFSTFFILPRLHIHIHIHIFFWVGIVRMTAGINQPKMRVARTGVTRTRVSMCPNGNRTIWARIAILVRGTWYSRLNLTAHSSGVFFFF